MEMERGVPMVQIDLITGFLGSGKTTFIKAYAQYLMKQGLKIGILENDFGAVNVDMLLLQELLGDQCDLEMVSGGCDSDCHRRRFKTKLIAMGMSGYDRVLVEPSGIYDVDEFFDALHEEPLDQWYEVKNVIAIVDAKLERKLSQEADFILASEAASAGKIVLSHADLATKEQIEETIRHLQQAMENIKCSRKLTEDQIIAGNMDALTDEQLRELDGCGYVSSSYRKMDLENHLGFDSLYFMNAPVTKDTLPGKVKQIMQDPGCGKIFRMKGFLKDETGAWYQLNASKDAFDFQPIPTGQEVIIAIGENLNEGAIKKILFDGVEVKSY